MKKLLTIMVLGLIFVSPANSNDIELLDCNYSDKTLNSRHGKLEGGKIVIYFDDKRWVHFLDKKRKIIYGGSIETANSEFISGAGSYPDGHRKFIFNLSRSIFYSELMDGSVPITGKCNFKKIKRTKNINISNNSGRKIASWTTKYKLEGTFITILIAGISGVIGSIIAEYINRNRKKEIINPFMFGAITATLMVVLYKLI